MLAWLIKRAACAYRVSLTKVDLPEPDTPVTQVNKPTGKAISTFFRLLPDALRITISLSLCTGVNVTGTSIATLPDKYCPVNDSSLFRISSRLPWAIICPPCTPAPGPISTICCAARIASSSCSTTITVLPRSRRCISVFNKRSLSRWCRPMDGSSSTYITPTKPAPTWLASRMRWASPPDKVSALRSKVR